MMDDLTDIREFYNAAWDAEENRLERHQLEADITWRYLNRYLPPRGRLLEIGFGTGFYTFSLAKRGYQITAIDLADEYVTRCRAKVEELGLSDQIDFRTGDARKLDGIPHGEFDAVLLMGPLYHLLLETDRTASSAIRLRLFKTRGRDLFCPDFPVRYSWKPHQGQPFVD